MGPREDMVFELVPIETRLKFCGTGSQYIPTRNQVEESINYYKAFVSSLELEYGEHSKELNAFRQWYRDCKEYRMTLDEFRRRVNSLLQTRLKLVFVFYDTILPYLYPLSTQNEVDRANQFMQRVKSAFLNDQKLCAAVFIYVWSFQDGKMTLEQMTRKVLQVLGDRNDLIKAYMEFVPQAPKFRSRGKFLSYPVIGGLLVAFAIGSAIGLSKIKK